MILRRIMLFIAFVALFLEVILMKVGIETNGASLGIGVMALLVDRMIEI